MKKLNEIIIFKDNDFELQVKITPDKDTVWLTQEQIAKLFDKNKSTVSRHISNIFKSNELDPIDSVAKNATELNIVDYRTGKMQKVVRQMDYYNLDVIISVGYRVNSKRGIIFRKWANNVLKDYMYKGFAIDTQRLSQSEQNYKEFSSTIKMIADMVNRKELTSSESAGLLLIISKYAYGLDTLDKYDHQALKIVNIRKDNNKVRLDYQEAIRQIKAMPDYEKSVLFGREKDKSFESALNAIYQSAFGRDMYPSIEEKAANLLYFVVKNHAFYDGNKRIAAAIFLWFLDIYGILYKKDGTRILEDNALVAIVLLIALSNPKEHATIIKIIVNLINLDN
ncbi:MAG TPA: virulence protein RhuM/Fic/DOC family protein [Bacilli bacterium]|nr:virulence protein RhuM/Fic/DOC family protein [Bacilli bacterium]